MSKQTPWGRADSATEYAPGIVFYSTPSHGGFHVDRSLVSEIPAPLRGLSGYPQTWYEEDCAWAVVAYVFPFAFLGKMSDCPTVEAIKTQAREVLTRWYPEELAAAEAAGTRSDPDPLTAWQEVFSAIPDQSGQLSIYLGPNELEQVATLAEVEQQVAELANQDR